MSGYKFENDNWKNIKTWEVRLLRKNKNTSQIKQDGTTKGSTSDSHGDVHKGEGIPRGKWGGKCYVYEKRLLLLMNNAVLLRIFWLISGFSLLSPKRSNLMISLLGSMLIFMWSSRLILLIRSFLIGWYNLQSSRKCSVSSIPSPATHMGSCVSWNSLKN